MATLVAYRRPPCVNLFSEAWRAGDDAAKGRHGEVKVRATELMVMGSIQIPRIMSRLVFPLGFIPDVSNLIGEYP